MKTFHSLLLATVILTSFMMASCDDSNEFGGKTSTPKGLKAVDLGLSVKWANMNLGTSVPEGFGDYYAWGETSPKPMDEYDDEHYKYCIVDSITGREKYTKYCFIESEGYNGFVDYKMTLEPMDDAATVNWGKQWRMPTKDEFQELTEKCTWTWKTVNGKNGFEIKGPNGKTIFLPAGGYAGDPHPHEQNKLCAYRTSTLVTGGETHRAWIYFRDWEDYLIKGKTRSYGYTIRPVCD